jgi:hypothetical protein
MRVSESGHPDNALAVTVFRVSDVEPTDIRPHIEKMGLKVPASLEGLPITWGGEDINGAKGEQQTITLVRPGSPEALGFTIGCITIRGVRICPECGWLSCRIVIKARF